MGVPPDADGYGREGSDISYRSRGTVHGRRPQKDVQGGLEGCPHPGFGGVSATLGFPNAGLWFESRPGDCKLRFPSSVQGVGRILQTPCTHKKGVSIPRNLLR